LRCLRCCLLLYFQPVSQVNAITLSPLTFELIANPGDTITNVIRVTNSDGFQVGIFIDIDDFVPAGEEGRVALEDPSENLAYSLARWITVSPETFVLASGESKEVQFTINVPLNAEPGGHYSSLLATISANAVDTGGVSIAQKVGSLLLLSVAGDVEEKVHIAEFSAPNFSEYGPVTLLTRFENTGTVHVKPRGFILIKNIFGKEVDKINLPQKNVLPNSIRRTEIPWGERYMFGKYEATLTAIYGSTNEPISAVMTFWVIPWKIAGAILLGALIILAFLIKGRKRLRLALSIIFRGTHRHPGTNVHA